MLTMARTLHAHGLLHTRHFVGSYGVCSAANTPIILTRNGGDNRRSANGSGIGGRRTSREMTLRTATAEGYVTAINRIGASGLEIIERMSTLLISLCTTLTKIAVKLNPQMIIEKSPRMAMIDCRFLTLFAVVGSLLGSALCFVEGSRFIVEAYQQHFKHSTGHDYQLLLIEGIDAFMVASTLLTFGISMYKMFVVPPKSNDKGVDVGIRIFMFKSIVEKASKLSVSEMKSKIGQAVLMILQVGVLEKFKQVPVVHCLDLACMGATILVSSVTMFILSRLCTSVRP